MLLLVACADRGPAGGEKPALASIPNQTPARYDPFERAVLLQSLNAAAAAARAEAAIADARIDARPLPPGSAPEATLVVAPPPAAGIQTLSAASLEDNLIGADDLAGIAEAVLRDRVELARRAAIVERFENPPAPRPERLTAIAFPPGSATLDAFEERRLQRAVALSGGATHWIVRAGGPAGAARSATVVAALVDAGVAPGRIVVEAVDRDVDVAEIAVRR